MASLRSTIHKAVFYNSQDSTRMVPEEIIVTNCQVAGFDEPAVRDELDALVDEGILREEDGAYERVEKSQPEVLDVATYRGSPSTPWQFSATRTDDAIVIRQARGPEEKFDPVGKRYPIEERPVGDEPLKFEHSVIRRIWTEDPAKPQIQSHRSEARQVEFLYRDEEAWHLDHPEPISDGDSFEATALPGVTVSSSFLRSEEGSELKFTQEREFRVTSDILEASEEVYVLSGFELNEESVENDLWEVEGTSAYRLVPE